MSQRADQLFEEAQALSTQERAILALQLLDSVGEAPADIERAWRDEIPQRVAAIEAGRTELASWDDARKRIFARE